MGKLGDLFRKKQPGAAPVPGPPPALARRLDAFRVLLERNNVALATMADLEDKVSGEYAFDRAYLADAFGKLTDSVGGMVAALRDLSGSKYPTLEPVFRAIAGELEASRRGPTPDLDGPSVLRLEELTGAQEQLAGGKMAPLGRLAAAGGIPVPPGFVITAAAFARFMAHTGILERLRARLAAIRLEALAEIEDASGTIRGMIRSADLPPALAGEIAEATARLTAGEGAVALAVRSSAVWEDGEFSFAGQYASCLNVRPDQVEQSYREVVASLFSPRAVFYYRTKGFEEEEMAMAVGVMRMVPARCAGVLYTRDPLDPEREVIVVNAAWGLGSSVVGGAVPADVLTLARPTGNVLARRVAHKAARDVGARSGGVVREAVPEDQRDEPCLTDAEAAELARHAVALEARFGAPQDVEWALDALGRVWILQSRPLRLAAGPRSAPPRRIAGRRVLIDRGVVASQGVGSGPVALVRAGQDLARFPAGAVLVARTTATDLAIALPRAAALVTDVGSAAGHLASLAREYRVPALLDTGCATDLLAEGTEVTVDAYNGNVYEGRVEELLRHALARPGAQEDTPLLRTLRRALSLVTPLNLVDPAAPQFAPEGCRTLHDVTRFCHEKAMNEMFEIAEGQGDGGEGAVALRAGIPVAIRLIDLGGGLAVRGEPATPDAVRSVPFAAFLQGMRGMSWPEPRAADAGGLLAMMAHTAAIPEAELRGTAEKSLALIGANYMNFSIRLGYHFSQVEAWVGEHLSENYVRFFFKGGGAATERRLRRVRLIAEVLTLLDFSVRVSEDVVQARVAKYRRADLERTLETLGKLTAYTKQLDMAMFNDAVTDWYREEFVREHLPGRGVRRDETKRAQT